MAMSPSPQVSPVLGPSHRIERHHTNSPPQQLSKRDKRRTLLADRLEELTRQFSQNRDIHYREQLQALQIDMNLIMEADAHGKELLPNKPDEIEHLVMENITTVRKTMNHAPPPKAGRNYADFAKEVNDAMEERDANLSMHMREYNTKVNEINAAHAYRMKLAAGEHRALSTTLRDRLINSITSKKNRLAKDKDSLEISDGNAHLLHPSQYGITNPSSPGGMQTKRATRNRREAEDVSGFPDNNKRKRKATDSDESPAPRQRLDNDTRTHIWFADKQNMTAQQVDSEVYSIDKLFTEKELAMYYNAAALAAHTHMQRHGPYSEEDIYSAPNDRSDGSTEDTATIAERDGSDDGEAGAAMERDYSHMTRSTRGGGNIVTGMGIDVITDLNYPGSMAALTRQTPKLPPLLASVMQKGYIKGEGANGVQGLSSEDANLELEKMRQARLYNDRRGIGRNLDLENGGRTLLEAITTPLHPAYYIPSDDKSFLESDIRDRNTRESNVRESNVRDQMLNPGGNYTSRTANNVGGTAMSRQNTLEETSSRGRKRKPVMTGN